VGKKAWAPLHRAGAFNHHEIHGVIAGIAESAAIQMSPARQSDLFSPSLAFTAIAVTTRHDSKKPQLVSL
jgi:hypothetical protein